MTGLTVIAQPNSCHPTIYKIKDFVALYGFVWMQLNNEFISLSFTLKSHD